LTHSPPWGVFKAEEDDPVSHRGSRALREAIEKHQPRLVICGHLHREGGQVKKVKDTEIYNVVLGRASPPAIIEI